MITSLELKTLIVTPLSPVYVCPELTGVIKQSIVVRRVWTTEIGLKCLYDILSYVASTLRY